MWLATESLAQQSKPRINDEAAIRAIDAKWQKSIAARDVAATVDGYGEDAIMMEPGAPAFVGKQAIRDQWQRELSDKALALTWSVAAVEVRGDMAFTRGRYNVTYTNAKGVVVDEVGKYLVVWKKVGKDWKVASEIYNADGPPNPHKNANAGKTITPATNRAK
jgi:ketosteroid isomerase-like protein